MKKVVMTSLGAMSLLGSSAFALTHVTGDIAVDTKWDLAGSPYILEKLINVTSGATLDIAPGVIIRGQPYEGGPIVDTGALAVTVGSKIQARGTAGAPIIFTTAARDVVAPFGAADKITVGPDTFPVRWVPADGDAGWLDLDPAGSPLPPLDSTGAKNMALWGGIILLGDSLTNNGMEVDVDAVPGFDDGFGLAEGLSGPLAVYGGFDSEDDSGTMKYVSIRHGGIGIVPAKEINALTLYGVGSKTTLSYIDIYCNSDDGVEIFGGTAHLDHLNIHYADDDGLDMDEGFQGSAQYVFVYQGFGYGDNGMELDGDDEGESQGSTPLFPVTNASIYNATVVMKSSASGARMRAGFAGVLANSIFVQASGAAVGTGVRIDGLATGETNLSSRGHFAAESLQVRNVTSNGFSSNFSSFTESAVSLSTSGVVTGIAFDEFYPSPLNRTISPSLLGTTETVVGGINPRPSLAASALSVLSTQDPAYVKAPLDATSYKGAFDRTAPSLWTTGWTASNKTGVLVP